MQITVLKLLLLGLASVTSTPASETVLERIVNGYAVDITEIPYQATLRRRAVAGWTHLCGAAVITEKAVLSAAHCGYLYSSEPYSLRVVVGTSYRLSGGVSYDASRVIIHEDYSTETLQNDIAIIITAKKISLSESVQPVKFAPSSLSLAVGEEAIVSGFGHTSYAGTASSILLAARVNIVDQETCARTYLGIASIISSMVCANASSPPRDACQGDSGGPLVANGYLIGIVSWGEGCADITYPGVYTRVSSYSNWIIEKLELMT